MYFYIVIVHRDEIRQIRTRLCVLYFYITIYYQNILIDFFPPTSNMTKASQAEVMYKMYV